MSSPRDATDALSALAPLFRVRPELQKLCRFGAQWASPHGQEPAGWMAFHLVTAGTCVLDVAGAKSVPLGAGDIVLLPHGDGHVVRGVTTAAGANPKPLVTIHQHGSIHVVSNTERPETELICGRLTFEQPQENLARAALPPVIVMTTADDASIVRLRDLLLAIKDELDDNAPGAQAVCTDLASALLVMVLRIHFQRGVAKSGLLRLLSQRQTARAVLAMIEDPARQWSLDDIASTARTSRATLVRDFRMLARTAPLSFLTELRLGLAKHRLATSDQPLADIAIDVGYQSQSALSRAFKRRFNLAPSDLRRQRATAPYDQVERDSKKSS